MNDLRIETLRGAEIERRLDALARLRIEVFRDWPYLYRGTMDYEREYLRTYTGCAESFAALAFDGDAAVGATTSLPLGAAEAAMRAPFEQAGDDVDTLHYFGESVVLPDYRGHGLGVKFFELREAHAETAGQRRCTFCAVERSADHPLRPHDYVSNDRFWNRRGYTRHPELVASFPWLDVGDAQPSHKHLVFWLRELPGRPA